MTGRDVPTDRSRTVGLVIDRADRIRDIYRQGAVGVVRFDRQACSQGAGSDPLRAPGVDYGGLAPSDTLREHARADGGPLERRSGPNGDGGLRDSIRSVSSERPPV